MYSRATSAKHFVLDSSGQSHTDPQSPQLSLFGNKHYTTFPNTQYNNKSNDYSAFLAMNTTQQLGITLYNKH